jgi:hypothetical protein
MDEFREFQKTIAQLNSTSFPSSFVPELVLRSFQFA